MASGAQPVHGSSLPAEYDFRGRRIAILPFTADWIPRVQAFNRRMTAGGLDPLLAFPEDPSLEYPPLPGAPIWQEAFLAVEDGMVRGAYYFTHERYVVGGVERWIANYRHPISEVVIDKNYKGLGSVLLSDGQTRQPLLYSMGHGSENNPNLLRLKAEGWESAQIPFWAKVIRPAVFFRQIAFLRKTRLRRLLCDAAAATGVGWAGAHALQAWKARGGKGLSGYSAEIVPEFGVWADQLWEAGRRQWRFAGVRSRAALNARYSANPRFRRLRVSRDGRVVGWAVALDKQMSGNAYFGCMRVGTIVDCLAAPGHEPAVAQAAAVHLASLGADLIVSNQSDASWCAAFQRAGFLAGPSNYSLAVSRELASELAPLGENRPRFHVTRSAGGGMSRL